jgi:transposase-like protein
MHKKTGSIVIMAEKKRKRPVPIYECLCCHKRFSARKGTPFFGLKKDNDKIIKALHMLVERGSIRGTARVMGVTKDTLCGWLRLAAAQCDLVNEYLIKNMEFDQVQLDELWTFVKKKTTYRLGGKGKK